MVNPLKTFKIWAEIKCDDFEADTLEEAKELFWESISDRYGIASATNLIVMIEKN